MHRRTTLLIHPQGPHTLGVRRSRHYETPHRLRPHLLELLLLPEDRGAGIIDFLERGIMLQKQAGVKRGEGESERTTATSPGIMLPELADVEKRGGRPDRSVSWCEKRRCTGPLSLPLLGGFLLSTALVRSFRTRFLRPAMILEPSGGQSSFRFRALRARGARWWPKAKHAENTFCG